jgi:hypothetical protein
MTMFPNTGPAQPAQPVDDNDTLAAGFGGGFSRYPVLKWQTVGTHVEGVMVDYSNKAPNRDPVTKQQKSWRNPQTGEEKLGTQDVLTFLVIGGDALVSPTDDKDKLSVVNPGELVSAFVSGHNRYDPQRPEQFGTSWYIAKDSLGVRGIKIGDLVRIQFMAHLDRNWNGQSLSIHKKVLGFWIRPCGGTPEELQYLEAARRARAEMKANPPQPAPSAGGFRPVPTTPQAQAAPTLPQPPAAAPTTKSLFD